MSRVGEKPITIPEGIGIKVDKNRVDIQGPLGNESIDLMDGIEIKIEDKLVYVMKSGSDDDRKLRAFHGLSRSLIANIITGVSTGFEKELEIVGVGYRVTQENNNVVFQLGYSHNIQFAPPEGVIIEVIDPTRLKVKGINKQKVGQVSADIRKLRPPEPYKGKGIRYKEEYVRRKAGKAGKV